jgi:hypothetical protein
MKWILEIQILVFIKEINKELIVFLFLIESGVRKFFFNKL